MVKNVYLLVAVTIFSGLCQAGVTSVSPRMCQQEGGWVKTTRAESQVQVCLEGLYNGVSVLHTVSTLECKQGRGSVFAAGSSESNQRVHMCVDGIYANASLSDVSREECKLGGGYVHKIRSTNKYICVEGLYSEKEISNP